MKIIRTLFFFTALAALPEIQGHASHDSLKNELEASFTAALEKNDKDAVKKLLEEGANPNQELSYTISNYDDYDRTFTCTALEYAARFGYTDIVKELLATKRALNDVNKALLCAAQEGHTGVVQELVQPNSAANKTLFSRAFNKVKGFVQADANRPTQESLDEALLRAAENFPGITAHRATGKRYREALKDYLGVIRTLIQAGGNVNHADDWGRTPLIKILNESLYTDKQREARAEIIKDLLNAGSDINHSNKHDEVALVIAIKKHDLNAVTVLLQCPRLNINHVDGDGNTPLIIALQSIVTSYVNGNTEGYNACINSQKIVELLLKTPGINPHHTNKKGTTAVNLLKKIANPWG